VTVHSGAKEEGGDQSPAPARCVQIDQDQIWSTVPNRLAVEVDDALIRRCFAGIGGNTTKSQFHSWNLI